MKENIIGCILGTAVGDSLGLVYEGLSPKRQKKLYKDITRQRFIFAKGMVSDDTDHSVMIAKALIKSGSDEERFINHFSYLLKRWFICLPSGIGKATLKACIRLLLGCSPYKSGVFSAGNGPAMRSALIGICFGNKKDIHTKLVKASTIITHTDIKAENGALAVSLAA